MLKIPSAEKITVVRSAAVKAQPYGTPPEINRGKFLDPTKICVVVATTFFYSSSISSI